MKKYVLVVAIATALSSCSGNKKADATQTVTTDEQETAQVPDMHDAENSLDYCGVYEGTLPAASSPGIKTTLTLNMDKTFTLRSEYIDEKEGVFNYKGTYTLEGNVLTAEQEGGDITYYKVEEGQLKMLDQQKQPITGDLAQFYILKQTEQF
ncbi:MAG: copper resistance protein NlpE [Parabacteroides sp.]|nr:copper resistance protein NlpE [Parabacteroides sp.]